MATASNSSPCAGLTNRCRGNALEERRQRELEAGDDVTAVEEEVEHENLDLPQPVLAGIRPHKPQQIRGDAALRHPERLHNDPAVDDLKKPSSLGGNGASESSRSVIALDRLNLPELDGFDRASGWGICVEQTKPRRSSLPLEPA